MIIDIIDSHDMFLRQWQKRRKYFSENKYNIKHTTSDLYDADKWTNGVMKTKGSSKNVNTADNPISASISSMVSFMKKTSLSNCDMVTECEEYDEYEVDDISMPEAIQELYIYIYLPKSRTT